jgi:hypothetical protein
VRASVGECCLRLALLLALGTSAVAWKVFWSWGDALELEFGALFWLGTTLLGLALPATAFALASRRRPRHRAAPFLRTGFALAVLTQAVLVAACPTRREPYVALAFGLAAGLFALFVLKGWPALRTPWAGLERALFGVAVALCGGELALRLLASATHPGWLSQASDVSSWIAAHRLRPGSLRFGFPVNSRGFYDAEPPATRPHNLVVVIGDSFGASAVPHAHHYTTVAEAALPGCEFYNVGVAGADPRHYLTLLEEEALPLHPDLVVVALFVGNDLCFDETEAQPSAGVLVWLGERRASVLAEFCRRFVRLRAEARRQAEAGLPAATQADGADRVPPERLAEHFPWVADPLLELPTFSESAFRMLERERVLATSSTASYPALSWLVRLHERAQPVPLLFLLIPDEFQVEDAVWEDATAGLTGELARDRPQQVLAEFFTARGFDFLDLLPVLRAAEPLADGRRHVYVLRDTHWNTRGNALAGQALARHVGPLLAR